MSHKPLLLAVLAMFCSLALSACGKPPSTGVEGTWVVDGPRSKAMLKAAAASMPGAAARDRTAIDRQIDRVVDPTVNSPFHFVLESGGRFRGVSPNGQSGTGTWALNAATGVITIKADKPGEPPLSALLQDGELLLRDDKERPVFVMVQGSPKSK